MMKVLAQRLRDVQLLKSLEGQNAVSLGFSEDMGRSSATVMRPMLVRRNCLHVFSLAQHQQAPFLPGIVRPKVEAAAKAEARAASEEDKAYEKAKKKLRVAMRAVDVAAKAIDTAVDTCLNTMNMRVSDLITNDDVFTLMMDINKLIQRKHKALVKVSIAKPPRGLARMKHARVYRICLLLGICMDFAAWFCAGGAFYRSIELQMGKSARADTIACFTVLAILAAGLHGYYLRLAGFED